MKLSTRQDTALPATDLFVAVSDFSAIERLLIRRGVEVRRAGGAAEAWHLGFDLQGRRRELMLRVAAIEPPERLVIAGNSEALNVTLTLTVVALARARSRLLVELEATPRNMRARLMLQTARLARPQIEQKFDDRIGRFVADLWRRG